MTLELAVDRGSGVAGKRHAAAPVEAVDRLHEPEARDLHEVVGRLARAPVAARDPPREREKTDHQLVARELGTVVCGGHAFRGVSHGALLLRCIPGLRRARPWATKREAGHKLAR